MGLSSSPHALQRILEPLITQLRLSAPLFWVHVDDIIVAAPPHQIHDLKDRLLAQLTAVGFQISRQKSQLQPTATISYLGLDLDFRRRTYAISDNHVKTFCNLEPLLKSTQHTPRQLQKLRGFASYILSNSVRIYALVMAPSIFSSLTLTLSAGTRVLECL